MNKFYLYYTYIMNKKNIAKKYTDYLTYIYHIFLLGHRDPTGYM